MANTAYSVLYGAVLTKLGLSDTASTAKAKICVNDAIREIRTEAEWPFDLDLDNFTAGTGAKQYTLSDNDLGHVQSVRIAQQKTVGDASTIIVVSNTAGSTYRYTYSSGTNPYLGTGYQQIGDRLTCTGFANAGNNVTNSAITGVGTNYIEITNTTPGVAETKTGPTVKLICNSDGVPIRRVDRDSTVESPVTVYEYIYSLPSETKIELNGSLSSSYGIFYDYIKTYTALSNDNDASLIPPAYDHVVVYLSLALMLELDDDTRSDNAYAKYRIELTKMKNRYFYNGDSELLMEQGGSSRA